MRCLFTLLAEGKIERNPNEIGFKVENLFGKKQMAHDGNFKTPTEVGVVGQGGLVKLKRYTEDFLGVCMMWPDQEVCCIHHPHCFLP
eukprot:scaffold36436_cov176-Amphora_coffeaeformis.AAC.9